MVQGALSDIRVLDLTQHIAGPFCTKLMAALGAEVVKVEEPGAGDIARRLGPFPEDVPHPEKSGLFLYLNTNKKSITLNLKTETGQRIFRALVHQADVLVENFEPHVAQSLGIEYSYLAELNPRLVMTSISNFGHSGPYKDYKATELTLFALGGLMYLLGDEGREPLKLGGSPSLYLAGLFAFFYTLTALHHVSQAGEGQHIDLSIMECLAASHFQDLVQYAYTGMVLPRIRVMGMVPCKDGFVGFNMNAPQWPRLAELVGMPELLEDPRFQTMESRRIHADELEALILPKIVDRTKEEIYHAGQAVGLPVGYVATVEDLLRSEQYKARGFFVEIDHPVAGKLVYPGLPFKADGMTVELERAPMLGEHNQEIYVDRLGYTKAELMRLRGLGII